MSSKDPALPEDNPQRRDRGRAGNDPETTRECGRRALWPWAEAAQPALQRGYRLVLHAVSCPECRASFQRKGQMLCIAHIPRATDISVRGSGSALDQCLHCGATGSGFDSRSGHPHTFGYYVNLTKLILYRKIQKSTFKNLFTPFSNIFDKIF